MYQGNTGTGLFTAGQTPFGAKPAGTGPTFGTATSTQSTLGFGQTPMFGGASTATTKPGLFGGTTSFGTPGFGTTPNFGTAPGGIGTATQGSLFGNTSIGTGSTSLSFGSAQPPAATGSSQLPIHQYILTLSEISQSSDHPLFRKMLEPSGKQNFKSKFIHK